MFCGELGLMAEQEVLGAGKVKADEVELRVWKVDVMQLRFLVVRQYGFDIPGAWLGRIKLFLLLVEHC